MTFENKSEVGGKLNREIVSIRSHARTRAESGSEVGIGENRCGPGPRPFPFSLLDQEGISFEFCMVLVSPSESW